jgi:2'-5' RNA ligase
MKPANDALFFIAILPDEAIQREVTAFKKDCGRLFGSFRALNSPPHVTLIPPFFLSFGQLDKLCLSLEQFSASQSRFELTLHNFDWFEPRVVFVDVLESDSLHALQAVLLALLEGHPGFESRNADRFHPHMTIAFKDLKPAAFYQARQHFSGLEYHRTFCVDRLSLLEHRLQRWEVLAEFPLL